MRWRPASARLAHAENRLGPPKQRQARKGGYVQRPLFGRSGNIPIQQTFSVGLRGMREMQTLISVCEAFGA
jgi:hypothetical protein